MKKILLITTLLAASHGALAFDLAVAPRVGTQGIGLDLVTGVNDRLNLRLGGYQYSYEKDVDGDDATFSGDLQIKSAGLVADIHPFAGHFRLSFGAFYNGNKLDVIAKPNASGNYFNNPLLTPDRVKGDGTLTFKKFAPYVGFGGGNAIRGGNWSFMWDVGALYQNKGTVKLNATLLDPSLTNTVIGQTAWNDFQADLLKEQADLQKDVDDFKWYPVVSLGIAYRF